MVDGDRALEDFDHASIRQRSRYAHLPEDGKNIPSETKTLLQLRLILLDLPGMPVDTSEADAKHGQMPLSPLNRASHTCRGVKRIGPMVVVVFHSRLWVASHALKMLPTMCC